MGTYVALLRGINVGGITITMTNLRAIVADLGFSDVRTVLASGNVIFDTQEDVTEILKARIEAGLRDAFDYDARVIVIAHTDVARILDAYPFAPEPDNRQPYVVFSSDPAIPEDLATVADSLDPAIEQIALGEGVVYWEVQRGMTTRSTFGKRLTAPQYRTTTTRNLRTLQKLR